MKKWVPKIVTQIPRPCDGEFVETVGSLRRHWEFSKRDWIEIEVPDLPETADEFSPGDWVVRKDGKEFEYAGKLGGFIVQYRSPFGLGGIKKGVRTGPQLCVVELPVRYMPSTPNGWSGMVAIVDIERAVPTGGQKDDIVNVHANLTIAIARIASLERSVHELSTSR